jgi:hypothetical protein
MRIEKEIADRISSGVSEARRSHGASEHLYFWETAGGLVAALATKGG